MVPVALPEAYGLCRCGASPANRPTGGNGRWTTRQVVYLHRWLNILVDAKQVGRIVHVLECHETLIVVAIGRLDALGPLVHHEIHVGATCRVGMQCLPVSLRPSDDLLVVGWIWIDPNDDLCPGGVTVAPRRIMLAHPVCSAVDRIEVHGGVDRWNVRAMLHVQRNCCVAQLIDEVSAPVPLQTRWIQGIKQALECWIRQRADQIERRRPEAADGLEGCLSLLLPAGIAPHNPAHRLVVQMFREGWPRRYAQESEEATDIFRRLGDKLTIPLHDLGCLAEWPQHRPAIDGADRVQTKQE